MDSQGMKNAKRMLEKLGWSEGTGLGLNSNGITEAVKPTPKTNLSGIGHKNYSDFQWWDHAFNKAAQAFDVKVTDGQGPVVVKSSKLDKISTKKGHANIKQDELAYGVFHKSGTLHNGIVKDSGNTFTLKEETDYSLKLTDEELFKVCNGLTAHKGARHGLTASGKLARIAQQEAELLAKMNLSSASSKKRKREKTVLSGTEITLDALQDSRLENGSDNHLLETKSSKKKRKQKIDVENNSGVTSIEDASDKPEFNKEENCYEKDEDTSSLSNTKKEKKKKKKDRMTESDSGIHQPLKENLPSPVFQEEVKKKKKKRKDKDIEQESQQIMIEEVTESIVVEKAEKKKKKKTEKAEVEPSQPPPEIIITEEAHGKKKKKKKKDKRAEEES